MLLDAAPVAALFLALLAVTERPVLAGGLAAGACVFLAVADRAKRATLDEPLAFTDGGLLWQVPAHPRFYLPFVPRAVLVGGIGAGVLAFVAVLVLEPAVALGLTGRAALLAAALALAGLVLRPLPLLRGAALARDPARDAARFGPLATFALHARLAGTERPARRAAHPPAPAVLRADEVSPHLVLLQLESFCDPRRFGLAQAMPCWDALAGMALSHGRLAVPGFGANTMRTEFVVLTGLDDAALGLDRLNPYFRFARAPVASLAWALGGAGYGTACLHPYDPRFFGRDRVLPALGFRRFEAADAFAGAPRENGLVTDAALGARIAAEIAAAEGPLFLYAITVAAHGPWPGPDPAAGWAARMAATDAMLGVVADAARACGRPVVLAAFGDHRPSLPAMRRGTDTDHLIWRSDVLAGGARQDLDAVGLHRAVRAALGMQSR
nr:LTA synthase family protein [Neoroseomonas eburnea]